MPSTSQTQNISSNYNITTFVASPAPASNIGLDMNQSFGVAIHVKATTITQVEINASGASDMSNSVVVKDMVLANQDDASGATASTVVMELDHSELKADFGSGYNLDSAGLPLRYVNCTVSSAAVTCIAFVRRKIRPLGDSRFATVYE